MAKTGYSSAEVKAGLFLTFCLALFVAMLFVYGKASRLWRDREDLHVVFTSVTSLRPDAPVRFNGVEVGRVKNIQIIALDEKNRARLPQLRAQDLDSLPLTDTQRLELRRLANPPTGVEKPSPEAFHAELLKALADRTMIELTLEVLSPREKDGEGRRYRVDDEIRITTTLLGDTSLEITSGNSPEAPPADRMVLGISGDFFSNLGRSVEQVKEILTSVSDVVGAQERESVRKALRRFDSITQKIENIVEVADKRLPATWDKVDTLADSAHRDLESITQAVVSVKPQLTQTLSTAEAAVKDLQGRVGTLADEARAAVVEVKGQVKPILDDVHYITDHSKDDFPLLVKNAKDLTARLKLSAEKLDGVLSTGDRLLRESYPDLRRLIVALRMGGENFEEGTNLIKRKPWLIMSPARDTAFDKAQEAVQKLEVATRRFRELSTELAAVRRNMPATPSKVQLERLDFLVQEVNNLCGTLEFAGDTARRQVLEKFERKSGAFMEGPEAEAVPNK